RRASRARLLQTSREERSLADLSRALDQDDAVLPPDGGVEFLIRIARDVKARVERQRAARRFKALPGIAWRCDLSRRHLQFRHEAVTVTPDGFDISLVSQRAAQFADADRDGALFDLGAGPYGAEQFILLDQPSAALYKVDQQIEELW